tara:strand:+ start:268 stop:546 length:279 start_codon:yes stop_codon:yes gene_type:complete
MNYVEHELAALHEFLSHVRSCIDAEPEDDIQMELDLSESDFWETAASIKFLQGHILKIKWEIKCPHAGCHWHLYYCKLAEDIKFQEIQEVLN